MGLLTSHGLLLCWLVSSHDTRWNHEQNGMVTKRRERCFPDSPWGTLPTGLTMCWFHGWCALLPIYLFRVFKIAIPLILLVHVWFSWKKAGDMKRKFVFALWLVFHSLFLSALWVWNAINHHNVIKHILQQCCSLPPRFIPTFLRDICVGNSFHFETFILNFIVILGTTTP